MAALAMQTALPRSLLSPQLTHTQRHSHSHEVSSPQCVQVLRVGSKPSIESDWNCHAGSSRARRHRNVVTVAATPGEGSPEVVLERQEGDSFRPLPTWQEEERSQTQEDAEEREWREGEARNGASTKEVREGVEDSAYARARRGFSGSEEGSSEESSAKGIAEMMEPDMILTTVKDAIKAATDAIENASILSIAVLALYAGVGIVGTVVASNVLHYLDDIPVLGGVMELAGITYVTIITARYLNSGLKKLTLTPTSPMKAMIRLSVESSKPLEMLDGTVDVRLPKGLAPRIRKALQQLVEQRNAAIRQVEEMKAAGSELERIQAEKEALQAVALQLASERDDAMSEVTALRAAVSNMTERMRSIEAMLADEVARLREQNVALETVAHALASERDEAIKEVSTMKITVRRSDQEKTELDKLASELIEERDAALAEVHELFKVVVSLQGGKPEDASGLTPQQETFLRSRARDVRNKFVDVSKPYEQQKEQVDALVSHLVEDFGAPREWTLEYMQQFLNNSASSSPNGNGRPDNGQVRTSQRTLVS
eukprot:TRINITY_DN30190_c0_g1_i1.p1 TRINITY_DN30190_c0_g1~~TRINITY_DN30190_c0_g1_i1.p1  ORF type:complete len:543 (+),score=147.78 TRINITY_DN30190_c0_g1_i1:75-1703(+)